MTPEAFINKHIVAALVTDGVPEPVARGGLMWVLSTITNSLRQPKKAIASMIVCGKRGCGFSSIYQSKNVRPVSGAVKSHPSWGCIHDV